MLGTLQKMLGQLSPIIFSTFTIDFFPCLSIFVHSLSSFSYFPLFHFVMFTNIPQCLLLSFQFVTYESQIYHASYRGIIMA